MLWVIVKDPSGVQLGAGALLCKNARVNQLLDGVGSFDVSVPYDQQAESLLEVERRVEVWGRFDENARLLANGIVKRVSLKFGTSPQISVSCLEALEELKYTNTLLDFKLDNVTVSQAVQTLAGLAGWTATVNFDGRVVLRFDGVNVLKGLQEICNTNGIHFRAGVAPKNLEVGTFGDLLRITLMTTDSPLTSSDTLGVIDQVSIEEDGEQIFNWLLPLGAGEGEAALTLKNSTRADVKSGVGANGQTYYYLEDAESVRLYGRKQKTVVFKNVVALNNSDGAKRDAANALRDATNAFLSRVSRPIERYSINVRVAPQTFRPGDRVRVIYTGLARTISGEDSFKRIDGVFWILRVSENYSENGRSTNLELASVDKPKVEPAKVLVMALENLEVRNLKPQPYPIAFNTVFSGLIQGHTVAGARVNPEFRFKLNNYIYDVTAVRFIISTQPMYTVMQAGIYTTTLNTVTPAAGANHLHLITAQPNTFRGMPSTNYPSGLRLLINGVDVSANFGGPWGVGSNAVINQDIDVTNYIVSNGIYNANIIRFEAESRTGNIQTPDWGGNVSGEASHGIVNLSVLVLGSSQSIKPA
jgi:hypothetical protein